MPKIWRIGQIYFRNFELTKTSKILRNLVPTNIFTRSADNQNLNFNLYNIGLRNYWIGRFQLLFHIGTSITELEKIVFSINSHKKILWNCNSKIIDILGGKIFSFLEPRGSRVSNKSVNYTNLKKYSHIQL